jgi:hypothetical protein
LWKHFILSINKYLLFRTLVAICCLHRNQREKVSQAFRDATVGLYKSSRVLKSNKATFQDYSTKEEEIGSRLNPQEMSKKRSFESTGKVDNESHNDKPRWNHNDKKIADFLGSNDKYVENDDGAKGLAVSSPNRMMNDQLINEFLGREKPFFDKTFRECNRSKSQSSEECSCSSLSTMDDLIGLNRNTETTTISAVSDEQLIFLDPQFATMLTTNTTPETKSDEDTFDQLLQLYGKWI